MTLDELDRRIREALLRAAPPPAPPQMASRVMERVERAQRAKERLAETWRARPRGWLATFAAEPAAAVALALVPVCLLLWFVYPDTASALGLLVRDALAAWITAVSAGWVAARSGFSGLASRPVVEGAVVCALLAISFLAFQWIGEPFRALRPSTSSRKSPPDSR
jgi:hypothetical protein